MASSVNKGTILYVEDNPDNRLLVKRILLAEDYSLLEAIDGKDALNVLKTVHPDLILMAILLPQRSNLCRGLNVSPSLPSLQMSCAGTKKKRWRPGAMVIFKNRLISIN